MPVCFASPVPTSPHIKETHIPLGERKEVGEGEGERGEREKMNEEEEKIEAG